MSFFYAPAKAAEKSKPARRPAARGVIPIESLNKLGCSVCPRDADEKKLKSPKMAPTGSRKASIYLLGTGPNLDEDETGQHWTGIAGKAILSKFSKRTVRDDIRFNHLTQCMPPLQDDETRDLHVDVVEMECCRPRVIADIEATKPLVVVGVGDQPLSWATGLSGGTPRWRGQLIVTRFGKHVCYYYPIMWPNFAFKEKRQRKSEYELALEHDVRRLEDLIYGQGLPEPQFYGGGYDDGIEIVTGQEAGDFQRLERALADMLTLPSTAIDIETNGLRPYIEGPMLISAAVGTFERVVAFSIEHPDGWGAPARIKKVHALFAEWLLYSNKKFAHNLSMEQEWLAAFYGPQLLRRTEWGDTMAMCHTLNERDGTKSLDAQTRLRFGFNLKAQSRVDVAQPKWWTRYPLREILRYNGMDSKWTHKHSEALAWELDQEHPSQWQEYQRKVDLCPTLVLTEAKGLPADIDYAVDLEAKLGAQVSELEAKIRRTPEVRKFGQRFGAFNPGAPADVLKLLRDICDRPEIRRANRDGSISTSSDEEVLSSLPAAEVPSAPLILEHRGLEKLRGTYLAPVISGKVISADGRIHSKYSSMKAETGRLAAEDPNIQNWPKRKNKEIRGVVYARKGEWIVAADYGQIEFRVVGMASEDDNLVKYCWTGYDVHKFWAERMVAKHAPIKDWIVSEFGVDWDEKGLKTLRQEAKNKWVFPSLFGAVVRSRATSLRLPEDVAQDLDDEFWDEFPAVKAWQAKLLKSYEKTLYVETLSGRRRRGPMTPNQIINHPIQGTAADIVLEGMNALSMRAELDDEPELQPSLNVHDDLSTLMRDAGMERKIDIMVREMCLPRFDWVNVPLVVEVSVGHRWSDLEEIAKYRSDELFGHKNPYV